MKKSNKNTEQKAQREAKAVQQHKAALRLSALVEYEANILVIGIDLGDRSSVRTPVCPKGYGCLDGL